MTPRSLLRRLAGVKPRTPLRGRIEGISGGFAFGSAVDRARPELPAKVEFVLDGQSVGTATATIARMEEAAAAPSGYLCGFVFDLRPHLDRRTRATLELRDPATGVTFGGDAVVFDLRGTSGQLDMCDGIDVLGWATPHSSDADDAEIEIRVDGQPIGRVRTDRPRPDIWHAGATSRHTGFRFAMPARFHDGRVHEVMAHAAGSGTALQELPLKFQAQTRAYIDAVDAHHVSGWIVNLLAPAGAVRFDVWINGRCVEKSVRPDLHREDVERALFDKAVEGHPIGFDLRWKDPVAWPPEGNVIELRVPGSPEALHGPIQVLEPARVLDVLQVLAARLIDDADLARRFGPALRGAARAQLAQAAEAVRMKGSTALLVAEPPATSANEPVDVIVPVYRGREETLACLHSVLDAMADGPAMELVVIFDAGPDLGLKADLRTLASQRSFTLIENESNLGFVATVNKGMRLHPRRDVVLLNADTVVARGWLRRLRDAALSAPDVATATPLSNRATIFSLPRTCVDNDMPLGLDAGALDALCAEHNPQWRVEVPTAMGFCMYIRRAALADVGNFDETRWAMGYGEENDFSLRALARGWRHLAACDVFVEHHGAVSFGDDKPRRVAENLAKLNAIYPDYPRRIERFIAADPIALARGRVNMALLRRLSPSWVLFVSHGLGGGTDIAIRDLRLRHEAEGRRVLLLRSSADERMELVPLVKPHDETLIAEYPRDTPIAALAAQLATLSISEVHMHHTIGFPAGIWQLPALLGVPFEATLHDFYAICPRIRMIDAGGTYCAEPEVSICEACVKSPALDQDVQRQFVAAGASVAQWRRVNAGHLAKATRVSAPSRDAAARLARHLPGVDVRAAPHVEPADRAAAQRPAAPGPLRRVAVIGAIGPHKGVELLLETATLAERMGLALEFVVVGYTSCDEAFANLTNVEITGRYAQADLPRLLAASRCGAALFLSIWPETYSYTLSEAWRAGMLPVALDIGAQAERIREQGQGVLLPFPATAREVVSQLCKLMPADGARQ